MGHTNAHAGSPGADADKAQTELKHLAYPWLGIAPDEIISKGLTHSKTLLNYSGENVCEKHREGMVHVHDFERK